MNSRCWGEEDQRTDSNNAPKIPCDAGTFSDVSQESCTTCPTGKYSGSKTASNCLTCAEGKKRVNHATEDESVACQNCAAGKFSAASKNDCGDCAIGKYSGSGTASCTACLEGKKLVESATEDESVACQNCAAGKFSAASKNDCGDCAIGKYSGSEKASCTACAAGKKCVERETGEESVACLECVKGKFSAVSQNDCAICPAGTYADNTGLATCKVCPKGSYNPYIGDDEGKHDAEDDCVKCSPGYHLSGDGTDATKHASEDNCEKCAGGKFSNMGENGLGSDNCISCTNLTDFAPDGSDKCTACIPGYVCNLDGTRHVCPSGTYSDGDDSECQNCPKGYECKGGTNKIHCPTGKYQNVTSQSKCKNCEPGKYQSISAQESCVDWEGLFCPPEAFKPHVPLKGYYTTPIDITEKRTSEEKCEEGNSCVGGVKKFCPAGTFAKSGKDHCTTCPDFQESEDGASECYCQPGFVNSTDPTGKLLCLCPAGKRLSEGSCVLCPSGSFKDEISNANSCKSCDQKAVPGSFSSYVHIRRAKNMSEDGWEPVDKTACSCDRQYYFIQDLNDGDFIGWCEQCPENTDCDEAGLNITTLPVSPGYWRSSTESHIIVQCYTPAACIQTNGEQCRYGHHGPICNVCDQGWAKSITGACEACENGSDMPSEMFALLVVVGICAVLACVVAVKKMMSGQMSAANELQRARHDNKSWIKRMRTTFKIFSSFYQVTSQFEDTLNVRFPENFENFMRKMKGFVTLDFIKVAKVGCLVEVDFYKKLLVMTLGPIALSVALLLATAILSRLVKTKEIRANVIENASAIFLSITYIVFAGVSTTILDTYNCKTYGDELTEYMVSDQSLACDTPAHETYLTYASAMIFVYPVGIPLLYFGLLWMDRKHLRVQKLREENPSLLKTSFLWDEYQDSYWWFEVFDCVRRLSQTGLLIFMFRGRISQIVVAIIMSVIYLGLVIHWKPYAKWSDNQLAIISQGAIFFTLFSALLTKIDDNEKDSYDTRKFGYLLILVNMLVICTFLLQILVKPWRIFVVKLGRTHKHGGVLRGPPEDPSWQVFHDYWDWLVDSNVDDAGWDEMTPRQFRMSKKQGKKWLEKTGAVGNWRCSSGNGPIDQLRVSFPLEAEYADVVNYALKDEHLPEGSFGSEIVEKKCLLRINDDQSVDEYILIKPCYFFWKYDFFTRRFVKRNEHSYDILRKSLTWKQEGKYGSQTNKLAFRADIVLDGIRIESLQGGERCKITRIVMVDFDSNLLPDDMMQRLIGSRWLRATVDEYFLLSREKEKVDVGLRDPLTKVLGSTVGKRASSILSVGSTVGKRASSVLSAVRRRTNFGKTTSSGGTSGDIDIEMSNRSSDFTVNNPMSGGGSGGKKNKKSQLPFGVGVNPNYDMSYFSDSRSRLHRSKARRTRFLASNISAAQTLVRKAVPQALGWNGSNLSRHGEDWIVRVEGESGDFYYEHEETGKTQWEVPKRVEGKVTRVLGVWGMIAIEQLEEGGGKEQIVAEVTEFCKELGKMEELFVPEKGDRGAGTVFVKYEEAEVAKKAKASLEGEGYSVTFKGEEWYRTAWWG
ncbi:hypothetical protein TL16_g07263 [Triparma laevis f. inornata]|uniref:WW domain-containing protein n=1 Tax=Triparma laevis f. inornata TaxID=1714386 RepID=A0A9W7AZ25_9STRA|nr:hypothetical protein TL16_g07263 [Triparma laevis f. inornata]